jgi:signal transduction histidine kinase
MIELRENWLLERSRLFQMVSLACQPAHWKDSLEGLFTLAKSDFIFDNMVIYTTDNDSPILEVLFARSTGRGKHAEADVSWGETISSRVLQEKKLIKEEPDNDAVNRLASPYLLGIPIRQIEKLTGVLVLIRFGGPAFSNDDLLFGQFLADLTAPILRDILLRDLIVRLESTKAVSTLQSDFISTISHELRNPLGFIKGYATTLLRPDTHWDPSTQKEFLEIIERETNNLTDLIEDLLDSSRLQSGQLEFDFSPVRVDSLVRDEVNRLLITRPNQKIEMDVEKNIPAIEGDARKLAQVFDNLLSNEVKYAPDANLVISIKTNENHLVVRFRDDGPGIPMEYQEKIFTRFFRVPEHALKAHGSGMGLFICKQIIEKHQGTIHMESTAKGTDFTIRLPIKMKPETKSTEDSPCP